MIFFLFCTFCFVPTKLYNAYRKYLPNLTKHYLLNNLTTVYFVSNVLGITISNIV